MSEAKEFDTIEEMKKYIVSIDIENWGQPLFSVDDIVIDDKITNDERIGWKDTRYVCIKRMGNDNYIEKYGIPQCIGMYATDYRKM